MNETEEATPVTESGKPASKKVANAHIALAVYRKMRKESEASAVSRANIQNLYDGNPPHKKSELRRLGLAWMSNVDWGEFRGAINKSASSIWNMLASTQNLIQATTTELDEQDPSSDYGNIVASGFTKIMKEWLGFHLNVRSRILEMLKFGIGACYWRDDIEWESHFVRTGNILVDPTSKSSISSIGIIALRDEMDISELMQYVEDEESSRADGWNTAYVRKKIANIYKDGMSQDAQKKYAIQDWESLIIATKNEDFEIENSEFEPLRVVHLLSQESSILDNDGKLLKSGTVTHQIFLEEDDDSGRDAQFFFEKEDAYPSMDKAVHFMMFNTGDGWFKSVRGLGKELFSFAHASNRLINGLLTGVDMSSGLLIQNQSGASAERFHVVKKGNFTLIPSDVSIIQQNFMPNINSAAEVRGLIQALKDNNTGLYQNRNESNVERTAEEVRAEVNNESRFENDQAEWYYVQWECWLKETFRRLMNSDYPESAVGYEQHKALMDYLELRNVPKKFRDGRIWDVAAVRQIGLGSKSNGMRITNEMISMKGALEERGRKNVDREWFGHRVGWENVDRFIPITSTDQITMISHTMAEGENIDMMEGHRRTVAVDDADKLHLDVHFRSLVQLIQRAGEGQSPDMIKDAQAVTLMSEHIRVHIGAMGGDGTRKAMVDQYTEMIDELDQSIQMMVQQAEQMQAEQQKQEEEQQKLVESAESREVDRAVEIERYKADKMAEVEIYKADQLNVAREQKSITSMQAQISKLQAELQSLSIKTAADIARKDAETAAKIARIEASASKGS
jgi:hypothetical protein